MPAISNAPSSANRPNHPPRKSKEILEPAGPGPERGTAWCRFHPTATFLATRRWKNNIRDDRLGIMGVIEHLAASKLARRAP